MGQKMNIIIL